VITSDDERKRGWKHGIKHCSRLSSRPSCSGTSWPAWLSEHDDVDHTAAAVDRAARLTVVEAGRLRRIQSTEGVNSGTAVCKHSGGRLYWPTGCRIKKNIHIKLRIIIVRSIILKLIIPTSGNKKYKIMIAVM
jgi:hypothetical protein